MDDNPDRRASLRIVIPIISISWHGGTRVLVQLGNYLAGRGHQVVFLVSRNRCKTPFEFAPGVTVRNVGVHTGVKLIDYLVFLGRVPFVAVEKSVLIANFFVSYFPVRLLARIRGLPYLYFVQDIESKYALPWGFFLNSLCNWTYRDQRIVAANAHLRDRLVAEFGTKSRSITVGPGPIFYDFPRNPVKQYDIVYFLRGEAWKGLDRFQKFLDLTKGRLSCLCVSQDETLRSVIAGSTAEFRKPKNDQELVQCIDSARVLLLTSYSEGFALPPLEAMARGVPTILFRCGGPDQYVIDGRNAIYVNSEEQAARAVEALVSAPDTYARMRDAAILTAEEYRMDRSMSLMAALVEQCSTW